MGLADAFQEIVDSLPDDWTDLEFDLRIADESRYVEVAHKNKMGQDYPLIAYDPLKDRRLR